MFPLIETPIILILLLARRPHHLAFSVNIRHSASDYECSHTGESRSRDLLSQLQRCTVPATRPIISPTWRILRSPGIPQARRKDGANKPSAFAVQLVFGATILDALKATTILSTSRDEEGAKRSHCRHRKSYVSCYELPVGPPDGVDRFGCAAGVHAGNTDYSAHNGEDGKAKSREEGELLSPTDFDKPDKVARNENDWS